MRCAPGEWQLAEAFAVARYCLPPRDRRIAITFDGSIVCCPASAVSLDEILPRGDWAILTAANPWSIETSADANAARMDALAAVLSSEGVGVQSMFNAAPDGSWNEPSFLVEGLSRQSVLALCWRFGQAAAVLGAGSRCGLLWTRSERWVVMPARRVIWDDTRSADSCTLAG